MTADRLPIHLIQNNEKLDVPVMVDSVKDLIPPVTRCVYFTIESVLPESASFLRIDDIDVPFFMLGLSGVICQPDGRTSRFTDPDQIDNLFNLIESVSGLVVGISDILLPTDVFFKEADLPKRGEVYRIEHELMQVFYMFRSERIDYDRFYQECSTRKEMIEISDEETIAFKKWSEQHVALAKKAHDSLIAEKMALESMEE